MALTGTLSVSVALASDHQNRWLWALLALCIAITAIAGAAWQKTKEDPIVSNEAKRDAATTSGEASPIIHARVASVNQSGGITAERVTIGHPDRTFGGSVQKSVIERLKAFAGTRFTTVAAGGGESVRFEDEVRQLLAIAEWAPYGRASVTSVPPIRGLRVFSDPSLTAAGDELFAILQESGMDPIRSPRPVSGDHRRPGEDPSAIAVVEITVGV